MTKHTDYKLEKKTTSPHIKNAFQNMLYKIFGEFHFGPLRVQNKPYITWNKNQISSTFKNNLPNKILAIWQKLGLHVQLWSAASFQKVLDV